MSTSALSSWQLWALLSAAFAALTAIFAKVGVENVNSDYATFIRTIVILMALAVILLATGQFQSPASVSGRTYLFLVLSSLATGASWICYFRALKLGNASQVAPIDKLSVVLVADLRRPVPGREAHRSELAGRRADRVGGGAGRLQVTGRRSVRRRGERKAEERRCHVLDNRRIARRGSLASGDRRLLVPPPSFPRPVSSPSETPPRSTPRLRSNACGCARDSPPAGLPIAPPIRSRSPFGQVVRNAGVAAALAGLGRGCWRGNGVVLRLKRRFAHEASRTQRQAARARTEAAGRRSPVARSGRPPRTPPRERRQGRAASRPVPNLEHFQAKWAPVRRLKMRQILILERVRAQNRYPLLLNPL